MQANSLSKIAFIFGGMIAVLFVVFDLFTSGGNAVAQLYRYLLVGGAIYGLLSPRSAFYLLIALTAYLDFTKRLMIFDSGISKMDLYYVLGVAPALMCGIAAHTFYSLLITGQETRPGLVKLAILTVSIAGFLGVMGLMGSVNRFQALGDSVNATVYLLLLPVVPKLFRTPEDLRKLLKFVMIIYTPAVLYMLVHWFRSTFLDMNPPIFDWELDYVKSGLTIEIRQLAERKFRPFGTFNSAANASMVFAAVLGVVCSGLWKQPFAGHPNGGGRVGRLILAVFLVISMYATYSRTGWVFAMVILVVPALFRSRFTTIAAYSAGIIATILMVFAAPYLLKHKILNQISLDMYSSTARTAEMAQVTNISTMNDRLEGFEALVKNSKIWTPFGFRFAYANPESVRQSIRNHDALSTALMKYGYVPLALGGIAVLVLLRRMHVYVLAEQQPLARYMASSCLAVGFVLCLGALVNSAQLITYPINFWIWFMFSCVVALMFWRAEVALAPAEEEETEAKLAVAPRQPRRPATPRFGGRSLGPDSSIRI
jgi:hypothetical protein